MTESVANSGEYYQGNTTRGILSGEYYQGNTIRRILSGEYYYQGFLRRPDGLSIVDSLQVPYPCARKLAVIKQSEALDVRDYES